MVTKRDSAATVKALCWKNWLVAGKNRRWNLASIIVPIAVAVLLAVFKAQLKVDTVLAGGLFLPQRPDFTTFRGGMRVGTYLYVCVRVRVYVCVGARYPGETIAF